MTETPLIKCADCEEKFDPAETGFFSKQFDYGLCNLCEAAQARYYGYMEELSDPVNLEEGDQNEYS